MGKIAFVFSGQGAQYTGMGKELSLSSKAAAGVFRMADALRPGTSAQCFNADKNTLSETVNTQPCLFVVGLAAAAAMCEQNVMPECIAGFSLGEIPALAFGGYLDFETAFDFVCKRALYMDECAKNNPGAMLAVLKLSDADVEGICQKLGGCYPVNYNCEGQLVVACAEDKAAELVSAVRESRGKAIRLAVSGAFHSPFMDEARLRLSDEFKELRLNEPSIPVYANATADIYTDVDLMFRQVNSPVLWRKTVENMRDAGVETFIEVGAGKTLCGLISKTIPDARVLNVEDKNSLEHTLEVLSIAD